MKVARQFIAWDGSKKSVRPVRDGVSRAARELTPKVEERPGDPSNRPSGTGFLGGRLVQAFHARLPSFSPSGTEVRTPHPRRYAHTPTPSLDS
jgi:hypothetical protein